MNSLVSIVFLFLIYFSVTNVRVNCQRGLLDRRLIKKFCGTNSTSLDMSSLATCAPNVSDEMKTIYSTCSAGSSPTDMFAAVCKADSRAKLNNCYQTEANKQKDSKARKAMAKSIQNLKSCLMKIKTN